MFLDLKSRDMWTRQTGGALPALSSKNLLSDFVRVFVFVWLMWKLQAYHVCNLGMLRWSAFFSPVFLPGILLGDLT